MHILVVSECRALGWSTAFRRARDRGGRCGHCQLSKEGSGSLWDITEAQHIFFGSAQHAATHLGRRRVSIIHRGCLTAFAGSRGRDHFGDIIEQGARRMRDVLRQRGEIARVVKPHRYRGLVILVLIIERAVSSGRVHQARGWNCHILKVRTA